MMALVGFAFMRSAKRGACNITHAATANGLKSGAYYRECEIAEEETERIEKLFQAGDGKKLWKLTEKCVT